MNFSEFYHSIRDRLDCEQLLFLSSLNSKINSLKQARLRDAVREKQLLEEIEQLKKELDDVSRQLHSYECLV